MNSWYIWFFNNLNYQRNVYPLEVYRNSSAHIKYIFACDFIPQLLYFKLDLCFVS